MSRLLITIITACYNSASTIEDTLKSVQSQTYPHVEHLIIDGHSTDHTLELVKSYGHVAQCVSAKDKGIYDAMNKGIILAKGGVIGILNSDDLYASAGVLEKVAKAFENPKVDAVYGDLQYVDSNDLNKIVRYWRSGYFSARNFYFGWMPPHPTFFVRSSVYEQTGHFNLTLRSAADYEMMLRILLKHQFKAHYIPEVLVKMRTGGVSNASFRNRLKANREDREAWRLNGLRPYFFTTYLKPVRKIFQFINK
ncbi:MAG TPA: glycosyltransferase family 2 protein [Flavitalea sp.]|nr:glycosyltransferase family 2 protein [Flavitalea sp.]